MRRLDSSQRLLIWASIVFAAIFGGAFTFMLGFLPPPSPSLGAEAVAQLYRSHNAVFRTGVILMILTGGFYLPFAVVICRQMVRHEPGFPIWAVLQGLSSAIGAWIFAFPPVLWGIAAFSADRNPEITLLMHEFAWLTFVTPASFFTLQTIPIILLSLRGGPKPAYDPFPRWMGYLTIWCLITGDVAVMPQAFRTGPLAWNGLISFYAALAVFTVWFAAMCNRLLWATRKQAEV